MGRDKKVGYRPDNDGIGKSSWVRDLGVMASRLKIRQQYISVRNKAIRRLGFIYNNISNGSVDVTLELCLVLMRPYLDCVVQFLSPNYTVDSDSRKYAKKNNEAHTEYNKSILR